MFRACKIKTQRPTFAPQTPRRATVREPGSAGGGAAAKAGRGAKGSARGGAGAGNKRGPARTAVVPAEAVGLLADDKRTVVGVKRKSQNVVGMPPASRMRGTATAVMAAVGGGSRSPGSGSGISAKKRIAGSPVTMMGVQGDRSSVINGVIGNGAHESNGIIGGSRSIKPLHGPPSVAAAAAAAAAAAGFSSAGQSISNGGGRGGGPGVVMLKAEFGAPHGGGGGGGDEANNSTSGGGFPHSGRVGAGDLSSSGRGGGAGGEQRAGVGQQHPLNAMYSSMAALGSGRRRRSRADHPHDGGSFQVTEEKVSVALFSCLYCISCRLFVLFFLYIRVS